jgi:hypothetical protein
MRDMRDPCGNIGNCTCNIHYSCQNTTKNHSHFLQKNGSPDFLARPARRPLDSPERGYSAFGPEMRRFDREVLAVA